MNQPKDLMIRLSSPSGLKKQFRVSSASQKTTLGASAQADIRWISDDFPAIVGQISLENGSWNFHCLDLDLEDQFGKARWSLNQKLELRVKNVDVEITQIEKDLNFFLNHEQSIPSSQDGHDYHLVTICVNSKMLQSSLLPAHQTFSSTWLSQPLNCPEDKTWQTFQDQGLTVYHRRIRLSREEARSYQTVGGSLTTRQKMQWGAGTLLAGLILTSLAFLMPRSEQTVMSASLEKSVRPVAYKKSELKPLQKMTEPKASAIAATTQGTPASNNVIRTDTQVRISKLIGKIAIGTAQSKNVVITDGKAAGSGPTGRALASLGNKDQAGSDWTQSTINQKIVIGTIGSTKGINSEFGRIGTGKTGNNTVGLVEEEASISGGLDRDVIASYIKTKLGQILYCYERQLSAQPNLFGKVAVQFTIGASGEVILQKVGESTLQNSTVENCILQRVGQWNFPKPEGGTKVVVTYPFLFKSTN